MNTKIGRNDPCYCGSGKKYKKCHLPLDEQRQVPSPQPAPEAEPASAPLSTAVLAKSLRELSRQIPKKERAQIEQTLGQAKPILAYLEQREKIEAASTELEKHWDEFRKLAENKEVYSERTETLFAEERFVPMRFTAADIQRAFEQVGYPPNLALDDRAVEILRAAILYLADKNCRARLSMNLLLLLPEYVAAGRYLDGWILQHCAQLTAEEPEESNPFLFRMFSYGYDAWAAEQRAHDVGLLQEVGLDVARLYSMSLEEIDAWLQAQQADPVKRARMEAVMRAHPEQKAQAVANLQHMEQAAIKLLERDDAQGLLLSPQEVEPWLPALNQQWEKLLRQFPQVAQGAPPEEAATDTFIKAIRPMLGEMAKAIFTPERIQRLIAELRQYRSERFAAGDKGLAQLTMGAITSLERESEPALNYFLNFLCFVSLGRLQEIKPSGTGVTQGDAQTSK